MPVPFHARAGSIATHFLVLAAPLAGQTVETVRNGLVELRLLRDPSLGVVPTSVRSTAPGTAAEPFALQATGLWAVRFWDRADATPPNAGPLATPASHDAGASFAWQQPSAGAAVATWRGRSLPNGDRFDVALSFTARNGARVVECKVRVVVRSSRYALRAVRGPILQVEGRGPREDQRLALPLHGGQLLADPLALLPATPPAEHDDKAYLVHPGVWSMQWLAYDDADPAHRSLFLGTRDVAGHLKQLGVFRVELANRDSATGRRRPQEPALRVILQDVPADALTRTAHETPYPFVLGVVDGDWYDAARFYRSWVLGSSGAPWVAQGPMRRNAGFSPLIKDADAFANFAVSGCRSPAGCFVPDFDSFAHWRPTVDDLRLHLGVRSIPSRITWWDYNSWGANWGEWFPAPGQSQPPNVAWVRFKAAARQVASIGHAFSPYFENRCYSTTAPLYGALVAPNTVRDEYGGVAAAVFERSCMRPGSCASSTPSRVVAPFIDPSTPFGQSYARTHAAFLAEQTGTTVCGVGARATGGARGLYLDAFTGADALLCFDPTHRHPQGGGRWWTDARRRLLLDLRLSMRRECRIDDFFVRSEHPDEMFLDVVELVYNQFPILARAPLYDVVYHDYQRRTPPGAIHGPSADVAANESDFWRWRQVYAAGIYFGGAPCAGAKLSPARLADHLPDANGNTPYPEWTKLFRMAQDFVAVLGHGIVRELVVLGERRRDPTTTAPRAAFRGGARSYFEPFGPEQAYVYAAAFARPDRSPPGDPVGQAGVLLLNWTDAADVPHLTAGAPPPGAQSVVVTIDPVDLGLGAADFWVREIDRNGVGAPAGPFGGGRPEPLRITIPARSAKLLWAHGASAR